MLCSQEGKEVIQTLPACEVKKRITTIDNIINNGCKKDITTVEGPW